MNQALDKQAILAHYRSELAGVPGLFCAISSDKRVIDLVAQFNAADERGRNTMLRMAQSMPCQNSAAPLLLPRRWLSEPSTETD